MTGFPHPFPASAAPYYALTGPWTSACSIWNAVDDDREQLGYVSMGGYQEDVDHPVVDVTTILADGYVREGSPLTVADLISWGEAAVPRGYRVTPETWGRETVLIEGEPVSVACHYWPEYGGESAVLVSLDRAYPVVIVERGIAVRGSARELHDARPTSL